MTPAFPVSSIDAAFYPAAWKVGLALGLPPTTAGFDISKILYSESSITPSSMNSIGCVGINQFCPGSLPSGITAAAYQQLTASQQLLGYVWPFWAARVKAKGGIDRMRDLYWLNWLPATYYRGAGDSAIVVPNVGALDRAVSQGKTYATASNLDAWVASRCHGTRWLHIAANLAPYAVPPILSHKAAAIIGMVSAAGIAAWFLNGERF